MAAGLESLSGILRLLLYVTLLILARVVYAISYRLIFHPLARVPGPKLAASTYLYQTYYSIVGGSRYYAQIGKLHEKYGKAYLRTSSRRLR
jgi:hypothetical protein